MSSKSNFEPLEEYPNDFKEGLLMRLGRYLTSLCYIIFHLPFILLLLPSAVLFFFAGFNVYADVRKSMWKNYELECTQTQKSLKTLEISSLYWVECEQFSFNDYIQTPGSPIPLEVTQAIDSRRQDLSATYNSKVEEYKLLSNQLTNLGGKPTGNLDMPNNINPSDINNINSMINKTANSIEVQYQLVVQMEQEYRFFVLSMQMEDSMKLVKTNEPWKLRPIDKYEQKFVTQLSEIVNNFKLKEKSRISQLSPSLEKLTEYQIFTPDQFVTYGNSLINVEKTQKSSLELPSITGDKEADQRIRSIAEKRGYVLRQTIKDQQINNIDSESLPEEVAQSWLKMQQAAIADGVRINLTSGYRNYEKQNEIFIPRFDQQSIKLLGRKATPDDIKKGLADKVINEVLDTTAPPGYSKHHSGKAIDVGYEFSSQEQPRPFKDTQGYYWLSKNNYYNAKRFGFVPSYPENAKNLGPEPESWEYIWVGEPQLKLEIPETLAE